MFHLRFFLITSNVHPNLQVRPHGFHGLQYRVHIDSLPLPYPLCRVALAVHFLPSVAANRGVAVPGFRSQASEDAHFPVSPSVGAYWAWGRGDRRSRLSTEADFPGYYVDPVTHTLLWGSRRDERIENNANYFMAHAKG